MTTTNPNGGTCVMSVSDKESPVYLRNFGNVLHLVDASGKPVGQQESVEVGVFANECVQRVTVKLAHQGFWHEGLAKGESSASEATGELKAGLMFGRFIPNRTQVDAMRLVAKLINARAVALVDDQYLPGEKVFRALKIGEGAASVRDLHAKPEVVDAEPMAAVQAEAVSFMLDPLEQAIESTVRMLRDEHQQMADTGAKQDSALCDRLGTHLDVLLAIQLERVTADGVQTNEGA